MFSRPGKIKCLESRMSSEDATTVDTVGKDGLISIQPTNVGSFLLEMADEYIEIKPLTWKVTLAKQYFEEKV